jgi:hypothetical protein
MQKFLAPASLIVGLWLMSGPAQADTCSEQFGNSCRTEVSTTTVKGSGLGLGRRHVTRANRARPKAAKRRVQERPVLVALQEVPLPRPSPLARDAVSTPISPRFIVDDSFNVFTSFDFADAALWEGLKLRQQMPTSPD